MTVPSYCVGQSLEYLSSRGLSKKDFAPAQIEEEKEMLMEYYASGKYEEWSDARYIKQGFKRVNIECASGTYSFLTKNRNPSL